MRSAQPGSPASGGLPGRPVVRAVTCALTTASVRRRVLLVRSLPPPVPAAPGRPGLDLPGPGRRCGLLLGGLRKGCRNGGRRTAGGRGSEAGRTAVRTAVRTAWAADRGAGRWRGKSCDCPALTLGPLVLPVLPDAAELGHYGGHAAPDHERISG